MQDSRQDGFSENFDGRFWQPGFRSAYLGLTEFPSPFPFFD